MKLQCSSLSLILFFLLPLPHYHGRYHLYYGTLCFPFGKSAFPAPSLGILPLDLLFIYHCSTHHYYHHDSRRHPTSFALLPLAFFSRCLGHRALHRLTPMSTQTRARSTSSCDSVCTRVPYCLDSLGTVKPTIPLSLVISGFRTKALEKD